MRLATSMVGTSHDAQTLRDGVTLAGCREHQRARFGVGFEHSPQRINGGLPRSREFSQCVTQTTGA